MKLLFDQNLSHKLVRAVAESSAVPDMCEMSGSRKRKIMKFGRSRASTASRSSPKIQTFTSEVFFSEHLRKSSGSGRATAPPRSSIISSCVTTVISCASNQMKPELSSKSADPELGQQRRGVVLLRKETLVTWEVLASPTGFEPVLPP